MGGLKTAFLALIALVVAWHIRVLLKAKRTGRISGQMERGRLLDYADRDDDPVGYFAVFGYRLMMIPLLILVAIWLIFFVR